MSYDGPHPFNYWVCASTVRALVLTEHIGLQNKNTLLQV